MTCPSSPVPAARTVPGGGHGATGPDRSGTMGPVSGVIEGFVTIVSVIGLGALLAQLRVLDLTAQGMLSRLAFFVASPALLLTVLADTDVSQVFSRNLAASAIAVVVVVVVYVAAATLLLRRDLAHTVVGALSTGYVNAGNLGLPIAAYVLGDVALVAPTLLFQLLLFQPVALAVLDHATSPGRTSLRRVLGQPFHTPLTVASLIGLAFAVTGAPMPLRLGPKPGADVDPAELGLIAGLKLLLIPLVAWTAGQALGLEGTALLAVTVLAALPTAQNIFVHANRYGRGIVLARDAIFATTVLAVPAMFVITALLA